MAITSVQGADAQGQSHQDDLTYAEPHYVTSARATAILSEVRRITAHPNALVWLNTFLDEFLFATLSSVAAAQSGDDKIARPSSIPSTPMQLPLTTERYKMTGLLRLYNNALVKGAILEAELVIQDYIRTGAREWSIDPAIRPSQSNGVQQRELKVVFEELRKDCEMLSPLGAEKKPQPGEALALYCSTVMAHIATSVLRGMAAVIIQDPGRGVAKTEDFFAVMSEHDLLWQLFEGMRSRHYIERDLALARKNSGRCDMLDISEREEPNIFTSRSRSGTLQSGNGRPSTAESHNSSAMGSASLLRLKRKASKSRPESRARSTDSVENMASVTTAATSVSSLEEIAPEAEFESLLAGKKTMKFSLTPNRLRTMESFGRSRKVSAVTHHAGEGRHSNSKAASLLTTSPIPSPVPSTVKSDSPESPSPHSSNKSRRFEPRSPVHSRVEKDEDDPHGIKKETLADFFASEVPPPSSAAVPTPGAIVPSASDKAAMEAKIAANRNRRLVKQQTLEKASLDEPRTSLGSANPSMQEQSPVRPTVARKRFEPKDAAPRESTARDMIDFFAEHPSGVDDTQEKPIEHAAVNKSKSIKALLSKKSPPASTEATGSRSPSKSSPSVERHARNSRGGLHLDVVLPTVNSAGARHSKSPSVSETSGSVVVTGFTTGSIVPERQPFTQLALREGPPSSASPPPFATLPARSPARLLSQRTDANQSRAIPPSSESVPVAAPKMVNGLMTPDSSIEDIAGSAKLPLVAAPIPADASPPATPQKVKRKPAPMDVSSDAAETLQSPIEPDSESRPGSWTANSKHSVAVAPGALASAELSSSDLLAALQAIRICMASAPVERHLAILDEAIAARAPFGEKCDLSEASHARDMEARVIEAFLSGDGSISLPASPGAGQTPALIADQSDDGHDVDEVTSPVMNTKHMDADPKLMVESVLAAENVLRSA